MKNIFLITTIFFSPHLIAIDNSFITYLKKEIEEKENKAKKENEKKELIAAEEKLNQIKEDIRDFTEKSKTVIDEHFQAYFKTSCRDSENNIRPGKDCFHYTYFTAHTVADQTMVKLDRFIHKLAKAGVSTEDCDMVQQSIQNEISMQTIRNAALLCNKVSQDKFAATYMEQDILPMTLAMNDIIGNSYINRIELSDTLHKGSQKILNGRKK